MQLPMPIRVIVRNPGQSNREFSVEEREVTIGRAATNTVVLASSDVSSRHACVRAKDDRLTLVDLGSTNGTFVNGRRVQKRSNLSPSDEVVIATYRLVFSYENQVPEKGDEDPSDWGDEPPLLDEVLADPKEVEPLEPEEVSKGAHGSTKGPRTKCGEIETSQSGSGVVCSTGMDDIENLLARPEWRSLSIHAGHCRLGLESFGDFEEQEFPVSDDAIKKLLGRFGKSFTESGPMIEFCTDAGAVIRAAADSLSRTGVALSIERSRWESAPTVDRLVEESWMSSELASFLADCVQSGISMGVRSGTNFRRCSVLFALCSMCPTTCVMIRGKVAAVPPPTNAVVLDPGEDIGAVIRLAAGLRREALAIHGVPLSALRVILEDIERLPDFLTVSEPSGTPDAERIEFHSWLCERSELGCIDLDLGDRNASPRIVRVKEVQRSGSPTNLFTFDRDTGQWTRGSVTQIIDRARLVGRKGATD